MNSGELLFYLDANVVDNSAMVVGCAVVEI